MGQSFALEAKVWILELKISFDSQFLSCPPATTTVRAQRLISVPRASFLVPKATLQGPKADIHGMKSLLGMKCPFW